MKTKPVFPEKRFSMPAWLYQMTAGEIDGETWYPEDYRREVIEGQTITWPTGERIYSREQSKISIGDTIIFFFCKTRKDRTLNDEPGIYGWGTITDIAYYSTETGRLKEYEIEFKVNPPSDYLKDNVLWDNDIRRLVNKIRRKQYVGNIWNIKSEELERLRQKIRHHIG